MKFFKRPVRALAAVDSTATEVGGHARLKAALAARDEAQRSVAEARETLERLQSVITAGDEAARAAADGTRKAAEFRKQWARSGCKFEDTRELHSLEDAAQEAARAAERAAADSVAVSKELARAQAAIQSAQLDVRSREKDIAAERGARLVAEQAQRVLLEDLLESAARTRRLRYRAKALLRAVQPGQFEDQSAASSAAASVVEDAINAARVEDWERERSAAADHDFVQGRRGADEAAFETEVAAFRARAKAFET